MGASSWAACREIPSGAPGIGAGGGPEHGHPVQAAGAAGLGPGLVFADGFEVFEYGPVVQVCGVGAGEQPGQFRRLQLPPVLLPQLPAGTGSPLAPGSFSWCSFPPVV